MSSPVQCINQPHPRLNSVPNNNHDVQHSSIEPRSTVAREEQPVSLDEKNGKETAAGNRDTSHNLVTETADTLPKAAIKSGTNSRETEHDKGETDVLQCSKDAIEEQNTLNSTVCGREITPCGALAETLPTGGVTRAVEPKHQQKNLEKHAAATAGQSFPTGKQASLSQDAKPSNTMANTTIQSSPINTNTSSLAAAHKEDIATKSPQEVALTGLQARKAELLASLSRLPAVQVLIEENATLGLDSDDDDSEPTENDIMAAANKIVKEHIKMLHQYNELKDTGQGLMGLLADQRGVRIVEIQDEFGIDLKD